MKINNNINMPSAEQVAIAIKAVENRQFMYNGKENESENNLEAERISQVILDALNYYRHIGLGQNIDEYR